MNKFTKTMIATAISGLMAGPASAVDPAVYMTEKASIKIDGKKCMKITEKNLAMDLFVDSVFLGGPNTGEWQSSFFNFESPIDGEGPLIAARPDKELTMDLGSEGYLAMLDALEGYIFEYCNHAAFLNESDTMIKKFNTIFSKNGRKATLKFRAEGTYYDYDKDADRNLSLKVDATLDNVD